MGRLALLVLVLTAAALYVGPVRDYFAAQDRYQLEVARLREGRHINAALKAQLKEIKNATWVIREARRNFQLVPPGMQVFVVNGLPREDEPEPRATGSAAAEALSVGERLKDLLETLLR